jgi:hypothetical protein
MSDDPTPEGQEAYNKVFAIMLALTADQREAVWFSITHNGVFCVHCGIGSVESPNPRCQCTNDE